MLSINMSKASMKIAARTALIVGVLGVTATLALARTNPTETTFSCAGLDLKVDSHTTYNGATMPKLSWSLKDLVPGVDHFFNFPDVKPGDTGETTMSMHLQKSSAWMCLDFKNLKDKDNGNNEPESHVDANGAAGGELSKGVEFFAWQENDGDNKFEVGEKPLFGTSSQPAFVALNNKTYTLADSKHGPAWTTNKTRYIGVAWCAGHMSVNTATAAISCDGTVLGNGVQTDSFSVDVTLRALPSQDNPKFVCDTETKTADNDPHDGGKKNDDDNGKHYTWNQQSNGNGWGWSH